MKLRTIAKIFGGLLALIIVLLLAIPMFISADYLKAQLVAQVKNATGRDLVIKGKTSLALFPNIAVSAEDVTLSNPEGFNGKYFVHIEKLATGAALKPLLSKQLEITGITLEGAQLNLEENASGAKNWEFASAKKEATAPAEPAAKKKSGSPLDGFRLGDVTLKDSGVSYVKAGAKPLTAKDINLSISGADGSSPLKVDGKVNYQGEAVEAHIAVEKLKPLLAGQTSPVTLSLSLPQTKVDFSGAASMKESIAAEGSLKLSVSDLPKLLTWATGKAAAPATPKKVDLKTMLSMEGPQSIGLKDLTLNVDDLSATGKLAVSLANAVPLIRGTIHVDTLDLDKLAGGGKPAAANDKGATAAKAPSSGWSDAPIDVSALRTVNTNLDATIDTLRSGKVEVSKIVANVTLNGGALKLTLGNANLYNGTVKGDVEVNGATSVLGLETHMNLSGIDIDALMTALSGKSRLQGTTTLNFALTGRGASQRALVSTLNGNGAIKVMDGAVKGINIAQFLRNAKQGFLFAENSNEKTDFTEMTASFTIAQGILSNNDLSMKSPILRLAGKGTVNLPQQSLNYRLVPTVVGTLKGQGDTKDGRTGLAIPLDITGPWSNPSITPDLAGMIQEGLKDPAALKQNIKDIGSQLKNFNSPKDIGKALLGGGAAAPATAAPDAAATTPATTPATEAAPVDKKQQQREAIQQGVGSLLNSLGKK